MSACKDCVLSWIMERPSPVFGAKFNKIEVLQFQHQLFFSPSYKINRNFFLIWFICRINVELLNCVFMCSKAL
jgi:hypothetical protein